MKNLTKYAVLGVLMLFLAAPVFAAGEDTPNNQDESVQTNRDDAKGGTSVIVFHEGIGIGLVLVGAGLGIGKIGAAALESMARQPEVAGNVQTTMMISAALIEGATFFALIVAWMIS